MMTNIACILGKHKFGDWFEVEAHLERKCLRCPKTDVKYPDPLSTLIKLGINILWRYHIWYNSPKNIVYPPNSRYKIRDYRKENL